MNKTIEKEFVEFKKNHKNIYNNYFHIICGFISTTFLLCIIKEKSNILLFLYSLLLLLTIKNISITLFVTVILYFLILIIKSYIFKTKTTILLFLIFYILPDLSHYITNETTALNINNLSIKNIIINIFYILPFSVMSL